MAAVRVTVWRELSDFPGVQPEFLYAIYADDTPLRSYSKNKTSLLSSSSCAVTVEPER